MTTECLILAAGLGTRMKSEQSKVLHPLGGRPMLQWAVESCREALGRAPYVVIGPEADDVRARFTDTVSFVEQAKRLGTGHAVMQAADKLAGRSELLLVTYADMPLLQPETLRRIVEAQAGNEGPLTLLSAHSDVSRGFGRILRDDDGRIIGIVEEAHADPEQLRLRELNVGTYCFRSDWLWEQLPKLPLSPKGEYYLTDLVGAAAAQDEPIGSVGLEDKDEMIGINSRVHLAEAEAVLRQRTNRRWMEAGVTLYDPATTYIGPDVEVGIDTVIFPNTHLEGKTVVGRRCRLGPNSIIRDSLIGDECRLEASVVEGATLEAKVEAGPFAHLRKGAYLSQGVHLGNFGEVKNSTLGQGVKMGHFSYIGDSTIGEGVNIGAGTITCNYDGERKHHTEIGEGAFIGSDTMLVAPVRIGRGARTGAGSVVTKDVPEGSLAVGVPARVIRKLKTDNG